MDAITPAIKDFFDRYARSRSIQDIDLIAAQYLVDSKCRKELITLPNQRLQPTARLSSCERSQERVAPRLKGRVMRTSAAKGSKDTHACIRARTSRHGR